MSSVSNIAITGATGFIGRHLLEEFSHSPYRITAFSRHRQSSNIQNINWVEADITDKKSLAGKLRGIDILIHMAAEIKNESRLEEVNYQGTVNILEEAVRAGVKRIIHLSSVGVYGVPFSLKPVVIDESYLCHPSIPYEVSKWKAEQRVRKICSKNAIDYIILRPTNVYGENHPKKILLSLMSKIRQSPFIFLSKNARVNYLYVKDLTHVIKEMLQGNLCGEFNVGQSLPLSEFVKIIARQSNNKIRLINIPPIFITIIGFLGLSKMKALANKVEYSDEKLRKHIELPYGSMKGIENMCLYYKREVFDN